MYGIKVMFYDLFKEKITNKRLKFFEIPSLAHSSYNSGTSVIENQSETGTSALHFSVIKSL